MDFGKKLKAFTIHIDVQIFFVVFTGVCGRSTQLDGYIVWNIHNTVFGSKLVQLHHLLFVAV